MRERRSLTRWMLTILGSLIGLWLVAPALIVIPLAFSSASSFVFPPPSFATTNFEAFFSDRRWLTSLGTSLVLGILVMALSTALGTLAAFALDRSRFPGRGLIHYLILSPMIIPIILLGIAYYSFFLSFRMTGTMLGFVLAHTVLALPFVVTSVTPALTTFDRRLELASHSLGADRLTTFRRVTLPLIMPGIVSGAIFAFVTSFDEIVVAIFLSGPYMTTIPVRMFTAVSRELDPTISAVSTIILTITTSLLLVVQVVRRPKEDEPRAA